MSLGVLLTPEQAAGRLQVHPKTVLGWLRSARLRGLKLGRVWRIQLEDLEAFLDAQQGDAVRRDAAGRREATEEGEQQLVWDAAAGQAEERQYETALTGSTAQAMEWADNKRDRPARAAAEPESETRAVQ